MDANIHKFGDAAFSNLTKYWHAKFVTTCENYFEVLTAKNCKIYSSEKIT